ncbi:MAG: biotin--protein ligase, partial [Desulfocurvibacter africanus]
RAQATGFTGTMRLFHQGLSGYLLAERLAMTLASAPDAVCLTGLKQQRAALFGPPPGSGGLYGKMLPVLEELARLTLPCS